MMTFVRCGLWLTGLALGLCLAGQFVPEANAQGLTKAGAARNPLLKYIDQPEEDDSACDGPQLVLYGVPNPVPLCVRHSGNQWTSTQRLAQLWGQVQRFYLEFGSDSDWPGPIMAQLMPIVLPYMDEAMRQLETVPVAQMKERIVEAVYAEILADGDDSDLPTREAFQDSLFATSIFADFELDDEAAFHSELRVLFETNSPYFGDFVVTVKVRGAIITGVEYI